TSLGQLAQHPREHSTMCFHVDAPPRARHGRMVRWLFSPFQPQELPDADRISGAPSDASLRVQSLKVAQHEHPKIPSGWKTRAAHRIGIESGTRLLDVRVESRPIQYPIHFFVERMGNTSRKILACHPQSLLSLAMFSFSDGHVSSVENRPFK